MRANLPRPRQNGIKHTYILRHAPNSLFVEILDIFVLVRACVKARPVSWDEYGGKTGTY